MGNIDNLYVLNEAQQVAFPDGVYIAASPEALAALQSGGAGGSPALPATLVGLTLEDAIPEEMVRKAMIVVIEADPASRRSMQRIGELRAARPYMPLIVALRDSDMKLVRSLVRQGVNDVVALPFELDQLSDALLDAAAGAEDPNKVDVVPAPLYAVLGSTGGCGATTVATHLAAELASREGGCCLLDLDVQFGTAGSYLGVAGASSVADLLKAQARLDGDLLRSVSVAHASGLQVVSAPDAIMPLEDVDSDQLLRILGVARQNFGAVVIDLPSNFSSWSLSALTSSSVIVLVVELSIASLRQAKRRLDLLTDVGIGRRQVRVVVNRAEKRMFKPINLGDVETALGMSALASIASEPALLASAHDQGLLAQDIERKNRLSTDIAHLAELLVSSLAED